ncbi:MAG TPA: glycerol-3-phosphate acyltransferase [Kofleriaceae bacterium]|nr:glycerol-3-phosphate acyltransferase [Kofleriaceae bacterium]
MAALLFVMLGFWAGAIPFGVIVARFLGVEIRAHGSGNIGATNVARVIGTVPGLFVLVLDAAKGGLPVAAALGYSGELGVVLATGAAAILGHCFSPLLGFRGGKGVATALGVFLVLTPALVGCAVLVFALVVVVTRVPALGSLAAIATIAALLLWQREPAIASFAVGTTLLLLYTHRTNLAKLRQPRR